MQSLLDHCSRTVKPRVGKISLHVHVANQDAIRFYTERFGFTQGPLLENYYRRLDPPHCYLLYKELDAISNETNNDDEEEKGTASASKPPWRKNRKRAKTNKF